VRTAREIKVIAWPERARLVGCHDTMPATGGGRNRRGRVTGGIGQSAKQAGAARSRVKLIG
jgi:hypothetical protein